MFFYRRMQRFSAWLACVAILMATLAPTISHAVAHGVSASFAVAKPMAGFLAEICETSGGVKRMVVGDLQAPSSSTQHDVFHVEHCPFCSSHSGFLGVPSRATSGLHLPRGHGVAPLLFYRSPRPLPVWAPAQSRAPPLA
jgi:hypothetical protein